MSDVFKLDIKTLIVLITLVSGIVGTYYTVEYRVSTLEGNISRVEDDNKQLNTRVKILERKIKKILSNRANR